MIEVRRPADNELCGYVAERDGGWRATTVFGGELAVYDDADDARRHVLDEGLASLADRWTLVDATSGEQQVVCICEASPQRVKIALGYYSLPSVPTITIDCTDLVGGRWLLRR